eukprot:CAMPEP_0172648800 /NCGR_PEP_ID=MMETSP1068-20121228/241463_1 /TAXON_ID=35684 /ORGANISM="Pseudopedinella elastica, Strain CCMP716" /LENGTH=519 /DNA_ID=CAMNT_0013463139 /DNA_START=243 /DNA_END=1808 /DNA_ORIENTATION=-
MTNRATCCCSPLIARARAYYPFHFAAAVVANKPTYYAPAPSAAQGNSLCGEEAQAEEEDQHTSKKEDRRRTQAEEEEKRRSEKEERKRIQAEKEEKCRAQRKERKGCLEKERQEKARRKKEAQKLKKEADQKAVEEQRKRQFKETRKHQERPNEDMEAKKNEEEARRKEEQRQQAKVRLERERRDKEAKERAAAEFGRREEARKQKVGQREKGAPARPERADGVKKNKKAVVAGTGVAKLRGGGGGGGGVIVVVAVAVASLDSSLWLCLYCRLDRREEARKQKVGQREKGAPARPERADGAKKNKKAVVADTGVAKFPRGRGGGGGGGGGSGAIDWALLNLGNVAALEAQGAKRPEESRGGGQSRGACRGNNPHPAALNEAKERAEAAWKMSEVNVDAAQVAAAERRARREARASSRRSVAQRRPEPVVGVVLDEIESHPTKEAEESGALHIGSISGPAASGRVPSLFATSMALIVGLGNLGNSVRALRKQKEAERGKRRRREAKEAKGAAASASSGGS